MRAAVLLEPEVVTVGEVEDPVPGPDEVLVRVTACGLCGSDLTAWRGRHPFRCPPVVLGHEASGVIEAVGEQVDASRIGEPVAVEPHRLCGRCPACRHGDHQLCERKQYPGTGSWTGFLAERVTVPADMAHRVPHGVPVDIAALAEPLAVACHALRRGGVAAGDRVAVVGAGTIGLMVVIAAVSTGASVGVVTDIDSGKLRTAVRLGAARPLEVSDDVAHLAQDAEPADVTFVAAAAPLALRQATALTRPGGTVVLVGLYPGTAEVDAAGLVTKEQTLRASLTYGRGDVPAALDLLAARTDQLAGLVTRRIGLDDVAGELRGQADRSAPSTKTIVLPGGA